MVGVVRYPPALGVILLGGLAVTGTAAGVAKAGGAAVSISNLAYSPGSVVVHPGDTVTWTNKDQIAHSVTADDGSFDAAGPLCGPSITLNCLQPGQSYSHPFASSGTFGYHCRVHSSMHGTVVVAAVAVTTPTPTGPVATTALSSTTSTPSTSGSGIGSPGSDTSTTAGNNGSIGLDLPAGTAPGATAALKGTSAKTSSKAGIIAVLAGCIALAAAGIGAVIYRIRADRRTGLDA
jgi:plastocyanin